MGAKREWLHEATLDRLIELASIAPGRRVPQDYWEDLAREIASRVTPETGTERVFEYNVEADHRLEQELYMFEAKKGDKVVVLRRRRAPC